LANLFSGVEAKQLPSTKTTARSRKIAGSMMFGRLYTFNDCFCANAGDIYTQTQRFCTYTRVLQRERETPEEHGKMRLLLVVLLFHSECKIENCNGCFCSHK
jgi:hypothetical protein